jgi:hypothetical protein
MRSGELIALANRQRCVGDNLCTYCGSPAAGAYDLPDSFTQQSTLLHPNSSYRCVGCEWSQRETGTATYPDGTTKEWARSFARYHNWFLEENKAVPFTYAHREWLQNKLLDPPTGPWICSLTTGGQRHFLYMAKSGTRDHPIANLDGLAIPYTVDTLRDRRRLTVSLAACVGAVGLADSPGPSLWCAAVGLWGEAAEPMLAEWSRVWCEPLSRLAVYLTPKKEDALHECRLDS